MQNYAYPKSVFKKEDRSYFSLGRMARYFFKPSEVNVLEFPKIVRFGKTASMLYPREGDNPVYIDNRALDGFLERFEKEGCESGLTKPKVAAERVLGSGGEAVPADARA